MAYFHSPRTVTDGLILALDAANPKSYPGSGNLVTDISGNGKNGSLVNGTVYNSSNQGVFYFDGTNDLIGLGIGNTFFPLYDFTIDLWFSSDGTTSTTGTYPGLLGLTYGMRLFVNSTYLDYRLDNGSSTTNLRSVSGTFYDSSWHYVAIQANATTMSIFLDGNNKTTKSTTWSGTTRWPTNGAYIGRDNNDNTYYFRGKIGPIRFYNRVLSASEVLQNYNATRGRFGL